jgi:hypothetical protein
MAVKVERAAGMHQASSNYIPGITAGTLLKTGAGNLHGLVFGSVSGSMTLYDSITASGTILAVISPSVIGSIDFKGLMFSVGLTVVTTGASGQWTVMFE